MEQIASVFIKTEPEDTSNSIELEEPVLQTFVKSEPPVDYSSPQQEPAENLKPCPECGKQVRYLIRHMEMHQNLLFGCGHCPRVYPRRCYVQTHHRTRHAAAGLPFSCHELDPATYKPPEVSEPPQTCPHCGATCRTAKGLTSHLWLRHRLAPDTITPMEHHKCFFCGILCKTDTNLVKHLIEKHNSTPSDNEMHFKEVTKEAERRAAETHPCPECGQVCKTAKTLQHHQQYRHGGERYECHECNRVFACKPYLRLHLRHMHSRGLPLFECFHCGELFKRKGALRRHYKTHIPMAQREDKRHPCQKCGEVFLNRRDLLAHYKATHGAIECYICDRVFFSKVEFGQHVITHEEYRNRVEQRPFACDVCGKRFHLESYCKSHKVLQHGSDGSMHRCAKCGKEFLNANLLKKHMRNHARQYRCPKCSITCLRRAKLEKHLAIHEGELRPFPCPLCGAGFNARVALHSHLRWHRTQQGDLEKEETNLMTKCSSI